MAKFVDATGRRHRPGEEWAFIEALYRHEGTLLTLYVEDENGPCEIPIRLTKDETAPGLGRMKHWFETLTPELRIPVHKVEPQPPPAHDLTAEPEFSSMSQTPEWRAFDDRIREALRLAREGKYDDARTLIFKLAAEPDDTGGKLESLASRLGEAASSVAGRNEELAEWLQERSEALWRSWASQATSGGEGTARVRQLKAMGIWK